MKPNASGAGLPLDKVPVAATRHVAARVTRSQVIASVIETATLILDWLETGAKAETVYDQWHLPPGCRSSDFFRRRHRALRRAGVDGVRVMGKSLLCTRAAWATELPGAKPVRLTLLVADVVDRETEIDRALGIVTRSR